VKHEPETTHQQASTSTQRTESGTCKGEDEDARQRRRKPTLRSQLARRLAPRFHAACSPKRGEVFPPPISEQILAMLVESRRGMGGSICSLRGAGWLAAGPVAVKLRKALLQRGPWEGTRTATHRPATSHCRTLRAQTRTQKESIAKELHRQI